MLHDSCSKLTVLCHFYNDNFILRHWLQHHVKLFDDGILINYASTDGSDQLVKEIAPHWKLVQSRNAMFDAEQCDAEVMEHEEKVRGWKIALNATEFIFTGDLKEKVRQIDRQGHDMVRFFGYQINDTVEQYETGYDQNQPLVLQRFHGVPDPWRHRILHKHSNGSYYVGRHFDTPGLPVNPHSQVQHKDIPIIPGLYLLWYRFSPMREQIHRKLQVSDRIPEKDKAKGYSWNHIDLTEAKLLDRWTKALLPCRNIFTEIKLEHESIKRMYDGSIL